MTATTTTTTESVSFKLNGIAVSVPKGWTVMQAAKREGVDIPHFCWHPGLSVAGVCRFCMVKVNGRPKLEIACNLQATEGMEVDTQSADVKDAHKWGLEFHLVNHPLDCPICDQAGECGLQDFYMSVGKYESQMTRPKVLKPKALDVGNDLVLDTERCILCSRCVRFEEEVTKTDGLGIFDRGDRSIIGTYPGKKIEHNYTTNLVDICPVGAFTSRDFRFKQRVWFLQDKPAVCPGCSAGCHVDVYAKEQVRKFFRLKPREAAPNGHWMCNTGRHMYEHLNKENRLLSPQMKVSGKSRKVALEDTVYDLATNLKATPAAQVVLLVAAQYTVEEYDALFTYFVGKLGIKNVLQWREPTEKINDFDGILHRGDHNANTRGLHDALKRHGITAEVHNDFDKIAALKPKMVVALAPEIASTFPSLNSQLSKLAELPYVSVWSCGSAGSALGFAQMIPMKGFAEKTGTFINHSGVVGELKSTFASPVDSARDVTEVVAMLSDLTRG